VRFGFDSRNRYYNTYPGWAIDNVKVRDTAAGTPLAPLELAASGASQQGLHTLNYPNPVRDVYTTTFAVRGAEVEEICVRIYNLAGQLVYEAESVGSELDWHTESSTGEFLANGVYLYAIDALIDNDWISFPLQTIAVLK
jgi:hypothetical protein